MDGMDAMGITKEEFAENLHMSAEELDEFLTPIRDYTISEIQNLLGALYLDIRVEVVQINDLLFSLHINFLFHTGIHVA